MATVLQNQPNLPSENLAPLTWARPSNIETAMGAAYDTVKVMTPTPENARNAV